MTAAGRLSPRPLWLLVCLACCGPLVARGARAQQTWDYDPYRVEIWVAFHSPRPLSWRDFAEPLAERLDRTFAATWDASVHRAPEILRSEMLRGLERLDYDALVARDLVLAIPPETEDAVAIQTPALAAEKLTKIAATRGAVARLAAAEDEGARRLAAAAEPTASGPAALVALWDREDRPAIVVPRVLVDSLDPAPRTLELPTDDRIADRLRSLDKLVLVRIDGRGVPRSVAARELDCPMRHFGPAVPAEASGLKDLPTAAATAITRAFAPVVRIEDAGVKTAEGRVRAGGLIVRPDSPAAISQDDYLQPLIRHDDREGQPRILSVIDWTYLHVTEVDGAKVAMDVFAGRVGGLQGRKNRRIHKVALKVRPYAAQTTLRLHARGDPSAPLIGYEVHEKDLETDAMRLVGRTDWDGRLEIEKTENPLRLLFVKNGGSVLARLPLVPGQTAVETADLVGDDLRLRAEAYLKGIENAIVDLVAIRQLLAARIRLRLEENEVDAAVDLLARLREQPTYDIIARDMQRMANVIRSENRVEQMKIDRMFASTRELLVQHITPRLVNELEREVAEARDGERDAADAAPDPETPDDYEEGQGEVASGAAQRASQETEG